MYTGSEFVAKLIVDDTSKNAPTQLGAVKDRLYYLQLSQLLTLDSGDSGAVQKAFAQAQKNGQIPSTTKFTTPEAAVDSLTGILPVGLRPLTIIA